MTFNYCGTGAASAACATVHLNDCASVAGCMGGAPIAIADAYNSNIAARLQISPPGVLGNDTDPSGLPLRASAASNVVGGSVTLNPDGSFVATPTPPPTGAARRRSLLLYGLEFAEHAIGHDDGHASRSKAVAASHSQSGMPRPVRSSATTAGSSKKTAPSASIPRSKPGHPAPHRVYRSAAAIHRFAISRSISTVATCP